MARIDEKVMAFVEETLEKSPKIQLAELFEKAKEVSESIKELTITQFHARYPLQVKRRAAQAALPKGTPGGRSKKKAASSRRLSRKGKVGQAGPEGASSREAVRQVLLRFAVDLAGAEETRDLVKVLADVDQYVDQVLAAARS